MALGDDELMRSARALKVIAALEASGHTEVELRWEPSTAPGTHSTIGARGRYVFTSAQQHEPVELARSASGSITMIRMVANAKAGR